MRGAVFRHKVRAVHSHTPAHTHAHAHSHTPAHMRAVAARQPWWVQHERVSGRTSSISERVMGFDSRVHRPSHICAGIWAHPSHIGAGTGLTPPTAICTRAGPSLRPLQAAGAHICTGTWRTLATSAPGPGSPLPGLLDHGLTAGTHILTSLRLTAKRGWAHPWLAARLGYPLAARLGSPLAARLGSPLAARLSHPLAARLGLSPRSKAGLTPGSEAGLTPGSKAGLTRRSAAGRIAAVDGRFSRSGVGCAVGRWGAWRSIGSHRYI